MIEVAFEPTFEGFRERARALLASRTPPHEIMWRANGDAQHALPGFAAAPAPAAASASTRAPAVPRAFVALAEDVACHDAADRWARLYRVLHRIAVGGERALLDDPLDDDVAKLRAYATAVRREVHHVHAFARFRPVALAEGRLWTAWLQPALAVLRRAAPLFVERFAAEPFALLTPSESARWDGRTLSFAAGQARPADDDRAWDDLFRTYYAAAFNPARANPRLVGQKLPLRWRPQMPEGALVRELVRDAARIAADLPATVSFPTAAAFVPPERDADLAQLAHAARGCRGCPLHAAATQTVFGQGPADAALVLVGEQPGDEEDRSGHPFVGPAGGVLDEALVAAGIDRASVYVTNAVKHFKFEPRGKWRIHQRPRGREVAACEAWLAAELDRVRPRVVVALGGTAARALFGAQVRPTIDRGKRLAPRLGPMDAIGLVTFHPSAALRARDDAGGDAIRHALTEDLRLALRFVDASRRDAHASVLVDNLQGGE